MKKYRDGKPVYIFENLTNVGIDTGKKDELHIYCDTLRIEHFENNLWVVETVIDGQTTGVLTLEATFNEIPDGTTKIEFCNMTMRLHEKVF